MFITIKHINKATDGPKHIYREIQLVNLHCTDDEKSVALKTIQDNAWFAHPENLIIVAMCGMFYLATFFVSIYVLCTYI